MHHRLGTYSNREEIDIGILYQRHAQTVQRYLNTRLTIKEDVEDLLVEVFMASLKNPALQNMSSHEQLTWLLRVARNKMVDHYRSNRRYRDQSSIDEIIGVLEEDNIYQLPEQLTLRYEDYARLRTHIRKLNALQQEVLQLRFVYDMHSVEIGKRLNKNASAIRAILSRALNKLRSLYEQQQEEQHEEKS
ncbi:RNA polymerase sigma factor [Ktedonobacter racemifer]|uniref:RNA polymerase, sigma-24 subunit, ECF subfamily n=1 Tax=Ktedonobacter racemifer DSM 44963 TaxID=485913 RepID=D6U3S2_KTERA|nr:sigma-70 family RNA polymerase sigma factor [Ktedonobacter racemifer]EFH83062.1 RNA polymerase, sigma-24 subunit, ECF subfamily [Ktedonobacter racemifer DSM 44963]